MAYFTGIVRRLSWGAVLMVLAGIAIADDAAPPPLLVATEHFVFEVTYSPQWSATVADRADAKKPAGRPVALPPLPVDVSGKSIKCAVAGPFMGDGFALAMTIKSERRFEYYWATWNEKRGVKKWAMSRIAMWTPDALPSYQPVYVLNPGGDHLRIQWERTLPIDENSSRNDWVLFEHRCAVGNLNDSGDLYQLGLLKEIPKMSPSQ